MLSNHSAPAVMRALSILLLTLSLAACGGDNSGENSAGDTQAPPPSGAVQCETADSAPDSDDCGQLLVGFTDAEGDFATYSVDVLSLTLERADGTVVNVLPNKSRIDFAQYVDLSELVTAATVPVGTYVRGEITLDYSSADIRVDVDGTATTAQVVDSSGTAVDQVTLGLEIDQLNRLVIAPGVPAMLQLDFDLAASHLVDTTVAPPQAELHPMLTAEVDPLQQKDFRIRGPLLGVDESQDSYRIAVRPFYRGDGRFGGIDIVTDAETIWDIDGNRYTGANGLSALAEQSSGAATVAFGSYDADGRQFTADQVYAGSSVPGGTLDAVEGHVMAREGNLLTIKGAKLIRADGSVTFNDTTILEVSDLTQVSKPLFPQEQQNIDSISVGQRVTALGTWNGTELDATTGYVRLRLTSLSATLNGQTDAELDVNALAFGARDISLFSFAGTGTDITSDADPAYYQVDLHSLTPAAIDINAPLRIRGFASPYGSAPADFDAVSVFDFSHAAAQVLVSWAGDGSTDAFVQRDTSGLQLNLSADLLGTAHHLRRGGVRTDLLALPNAPALTPAGNRGIYALAEKGAITFHSDFGNFVTDLDARLGRGARVKLLHSIGGYRDNGFTFTRLALVLTR